MPVHVPEAGGAGADHLHAGQARPPVDVLGIELRLDRPDLLPQPPHQRQVAAVAAEERHRGVGVAVDQRRDQRRAGGVDRLVAGLRGHLRAQRRDRAVLAAAQADGLAVEGGVGDGQAHPARPGSRESRALGEALGVRLAVGLQLGDAERVGADPVRQVVDHAERRIGEAELAGDDALGGDRHPDQVGVRGDRPDLGRGLESGPDRLPVDTAVEEAVDPGRCGNHPPAPIAVEARRDVAALVVEGRQPQVEGDEIVGTDQGADPDPLFQRAHRADRQRSVAARLEQGADVGRVVDAVWKHIVAVPVALQDDGAVGACGDGHPLAARAGRAAAENHRQSSHPHRS